MNKKYRFFLFCFANILLPLFIGMLVYLCSPGTTYISDWVEEFFPFSSPQLNSSLVQKFARNYLCDAFWAYSLSFSLHVFVKKIHHVFLICLFWCGLFEYFQKIGTIPGTFDIWDIVFELIAVITALSIIFFTKKRC